MKLFNKGDTNQESTPQIGRISRMDTQSLRGWFDSTLMGLGSAYDHWRYHNGPEELVEEHLNVLNHLWAEIGKRNNND